MKTPAEITRSNARILLRQVRGKSKEERQAVYAALRTGAILWPVMALVRAGLQDPAKA